jgi:hypothetical protein
MRNELLTLFSRVRLAPATGAGEIASAREISAFNAETGFLGYTLDASVLGELRLRSPEELRSIRSQLLGLMKKVSGSGVRHDVLFSRFPYEIPSDGDYLMNRLVAQLQHLFGTPSNDFTSLSCGHVIDASLFPDLSEFGACPVCQHQVDELDQVDVARIPYERLTPLKVVKLADEGFLRDAAGKLVSRASSLSADEKSFLTACIREGVAIEVTGRIYRETLPFLFVAYDDVDRIRPLMSGATDVLRIATYLSDESADLSLKDNVRFKLTTRRRKQILDLLEGLPSIEEDLLRHRSRWIKLGERLTLTSSAAIARWPRTCLAFDKLRNAPETIHTLSRSVEGMVRSKQIDAKIVAELSRRPGDFLRRLDAMLRSDGDVENVLRILPSVAKGATTRLLFDLCKYLDHRMSDGREKRVFFPKGQVNKVQVRDDTRKSLPVDVVLRAHAVLEQELKTRVGGMAAMGKVWIDPTLRGHVLPFNRRGDSSTTVPVAKGSRFACDADVVRLFIHWIGSGIDVDLSLLTFDGNFRVMEQVSYTRLSGSDGMVHSGDIQSAPKGASEFIDFNPTSIQRNGARYLAMVVISFRGESFDTFPCFAGFMERDALKSGLRYEPESVKVKLDVAGKTLSAIPLVFDLVERSVLFTDLSTGGGRHASVERHSEKYGTLVKAAIGIADRKPTAYDVISLHARTRGRIVSGREEADICFDARTIDMEEVLQMAS